MKSKKILYIQFNNPSAFPPIIHGTGFFVEKEWKVFHLGCYFGGAENLTFAPMSNVAMNIFPKRNEGIEQKIFYLYFQVSGVFKALWWDADVVYISDNLATPAGWALRNVFGKTVVYHEHDDPSQERESLVFKVVKWFRRSLASTASLIVLPQRTRLELFLREMGSRSPSYCVWNCPTMAETRRIFPSMRKSNEPLRIYFHGSINLNMLPLELVEALGTSGFPSVLRIVGYETNASMGALARLREAAEPFADTLKLEILGPLSRSELIDAMSEMHIGWINFPTDVDYHNVVMRHLAGASNKAFDYMAAGLALIFPEDKEWKEIYSEYGKTCNPKDVDGIVSLLKWFYEHPEETYRIGQSGQNKIQADWNYETQFEPVFRHIEKLVSTR